MNEESPGKKILEVEQEPTDFKVFLTFELKGWWYEVHFAVSLLDK